MGLPNINIIFKTKGVTAIQRSERGIVAIVLDDNTEGGKEVEILKSVSDINKSLYTERSYEYLKLVYEGAPNRVIVARRQAGATDYSEVLKVLGNYSWNYLTIPQIESKDVVMISAWIKERRAEQKTYKVILPNYKGDHEAIINFTSDNILSNLGEDIFECNEYCARIAGLLAGLSLARSSTYFVLNDILYADTKEEPSKCIDAGELIIVFDGENYKIGRGVNSFVSFTTEKGQEFSKIKIMEGVDLYNDDIRSTFASSYVGKYRNDYDTKQMFVAAVNAYNKQLEGDVLDITYNNNTYIDVEAQRLYIEGKGIDTSAMNDIEIAQYNTGSNVFLASKIKFVDAMEDLYMTNNM